MLYKFYCDFTISNLTGDRRKCMKEQGTCLQENELSFELINNKKIYKYYEYSQHMRNH